MAAFNRTKVRLARKAVEDMLGDTVRTTVQESKNGRGKVIPAAMALSPAPRASRHTQLYNLLSGASTAVRVAAVRVIVKRMLSELPAVFAKIPLTPAHFGFDNLDEFIKFLGKELAKSGTTAESRADFVAGLPGWRWNLVGRILFERLVRYHPQLEPFFQKMAQDWFSIINSETRELVNLAGNRVSAVGTFGKFRRVEYFIMEGADGVERASADFGFMATDGLGRVALLPIEIKMPAALAGVAGQFSEFVPRLTEAKVLYAVVVDAKGKQTKVEIAPNKIVFLNNDGAQLAVAPLSKKRAETLLKGKKVAKDRVASIVDLDQGTSSRYSIAYYRARILVDRSWLESIVAAITDPPRK